ncbi:MAG: sodium:calcium antiporter, partial [Nanoarchaeota archaeon]|nr:sodium:calcium antiporter [Nanoarchaeota archaeon]
LDPVSDGSSLFARSASGGLTVVAFGTSLPELMVGIFSSINGNAGIVFGNVIGANIANVLLILGVTAIIQNIDVKTETIWKQIPFALLAAFILFLFSAQTFFGLERTSLTFVEGGLFVALLIYFLYSVTQMSKREIRKKKVHLDFDLVTNIWSIMKVSERVNEIRGGFSRLDWKVLVKFVVGVVMIYFGGRWVVTGAVFIAEQFGWSSFLISATIVSLGTTLPEFIVSIFATFRGKVDMAVGNVVGSTIFNVFGVLGISALFNTMLIPSFIYIDVAIMFFAFLLLFIFMFVGPNHKLSRKDGIVFVLLYVLYLAYVIVRG